MTIVTVGIDLAKNVFAVHGVDETGKAVLVRPEVPRAKLKELIANVPPCPDGINVYSALPHERQTRRLRLPNKPLLGPHSIPQRHRPAGQKQHHDEPMRFEKQVLPAKGAQRH